MSSRKVAAVPLLVLRVLLWLTVTVGMVLATIQFYVKMIKALLDAEHPNRRQDRDQGRDRLTG